MVRGCEGDVGQPVKGELAVWLGVVDWLEVGSLTRGLGVGFAVLEVQWRSAKDVVAPHIGTANGQRCGQPVVGPQRLHVAKGLIHLNNPWNWQITKHKIDCKRNCLFLFKKRLLCIFISRIIKN